MSSVRLCPMDPNRHLSLGGGMADPYLPHAHPFGPTQGLVALCSHNADCRIDGHITRGDNGYEHAHGVGCSCGAPDCNGGES